MTFSNTRAPKHAAVRSNRRTAGTIGRQAAVLVAASGMVLSGAMAANAADAPTQRDAAPASSVDIQGQVSAPVMADSAVQITFERPAVETAPAPVVEAPKPVAAPKAPAAPAAAPAAPAAAKATVKVQAAPAAAPAPAAGGVNATLLSVAYGQIGITQDCTAMVEKALNAAGIPVGNIGPQAFLKYGKVVAAPLPGDIIVQSGHVAIYAGNGQAISGGMNGVNATMAHPLSWLTATGPVTFVRAG
ncbi:cell wall-associated NlpC family hydrolase [Arthrobacter ginsengisoli]|uniref:Cell wall-associated NlpC family hydrolase n=1 Tax=Arthrobacter ginsengisoli TaxID=1356565 RepID=A0ABU1U727_9MICC|nr:cell wall-associated NlpC family hydrolase [Arthrobacter ginsengisoli]